MAVDVCTEISSPRISFSYDLKDFDFVPVENHGRRSDSFLLNPAVDFDLCRGLLPHEISSADELFADGKILPVQIKRPDITPPDPVPARTKPKPNVAPQEDQNDLKNENTEKKRLVEAIQKQQSLKEGSEDRRSSSPAATATATPNRCHYYYPYNNDNNNNNKCNINCEGNTTAYRRGSLRKSGSRSGVDSKNGVRVNPVLNIAPAYIGKGTVSLFGIGSFFSSSKKSKKKR
ncbi:Unknown protein [Striga hermonthica]|uniref:Uncharacterized protein n=1 Tax=Striga hermonthica TaxID=68872 RepID=A0A9N7NZ58_STRHE|nr:Unknown protein [Striga hermonthica]